jgi:hypothetical protein
LVRAFFWIGFEVCSFGLAQLLAVWFLSPHGQWAFEEKVPSKKMARRSSGWKR